MAGQEAKPPGSERAGASGAAKAAPAQVSDPPAASPATLPLATEAAFRVPKLCVCSPPPKRDFSRPRPDVLEVRAPSFWAVTVRSRAARAPPLSFSYSEFSVYGISDDDTETSRFPHF